MQATPHPNLLFRRGLVISGAVLLAALSTHAANFMAPDQIDLDSVLPPHPADDSLATRAELEVVLQMVRDRTPEQTEFARNPPTSDVFAFAAPVLGDWFTPENLLKTAALFAKIDDDSRPIATAAKSIYPLRQRPFLVDDRIANPTSRPGGSTYPSGAGYNTAVWSSVLSTIFPEQAEALRTRAQFACWTRVIVQTSEEDAAGYCPAVCKVVSTGPKVSTA